MEIHPWEKAAKRLRERGKPFIFEEFWKELENIGHGYYYINKKGEQELRKGYPIRTAAKKDAVMKNLKGDIVKEGATVYADLYKKHLKTAIEVYNKVKKALGKNLKVFAVRGGTLTMNMYGVPVKMRDVPDIGMVDDLDLLIVVDNLKDSEKVARIVREIEEKYNTPIEVVWNYMPLTKEEGYMLPQVAPKNKPLAFFEGREEFERMIKECREEGRCEEAPYTPHKYRESIEEELKKAVKDTIEGRFRPDKNIEDKVEILWHLFSTPALSEFMESTLEKIRDKNTKRRAMAAILQRYLEMLDKTYKYHSLILKLKKH